MKQISEQRQVRLICFCLAFVTFVLYVRTSGYDFVNYDDFSYLVENSYVHHGLTLDSLKWAFTTGRESNWHPLTWISLLIDWQMFGPHHPGGFHFVNVLFHTANVMLLFLALSRMTKRIWPSAVAAALFGWHPLHVESVAWIAERKDVLSAFFWLLTLRAYTRYVELTKNQSPTAKKFYFLTLLWFALGLMSKPMVVTLPFVLLLLDFWPFRRNAILDSGKSPWPQLISEKWPFLVLTLASSIVTYQVQKHGGAMTSLAATSPTLHVENALSAYVSYLWKTICPTGLGVLYPYQYHFSLLRVIGAGIFLVFATISSFLLGRSRPYVLVGWLWYLGTLVPVIGLVQVGMQSMADRYTYLPLIGIFIIFAWGMADFFAGKTLAALHRGQMVVGLILFACILATSRQLGYWKDTETLFRRDLAVTTNNVIAHINLGRALDDSGRPEEAKAEFITALQIEPESPRTLTSVGAHFARNGDYTNALGYYGVALRNQPFYGDAHYNLANVFVHEGALNEAIEQYNEALRIKPDAPDAHNNLGAVLARLGRLPEARAQFEEALRLRSEFPEAQDQLGGILLKLGHPEQAQVHYEQAVRLNPDFAHAQLKLGLVLAQQSYLTEALPHFEAAVKLEPTNADASFNLAADYAALRRFDQAADAFAQVLRLNPSDAEARVRLAAALVGENKFAAAIVAYREVLQGKPDNVSALNGLAWILATNPNSTVRDGAEAVRLGEHAVELTQRKDAMILSTLDAAYAEAGRFSDAIKTAQEVEQIATAHNQTGIANHAAERLALYRAGKPYHE